MIEEERAVAPKSIVNAMKHEHAATIERMARCNTVLNRNAPLHIVKSETLLQCQDRVEGWFPISNPFPREIALWKVWKNLRLMVRLQAEQDSHVLLEEKKTTVDEEADALFEVVSLKIDMTRVLFKLPIAIQKLHMFESVRRCKRQLLQPIFVALWSLFPRIVASTITAWLVFLDERFHELVFLVLGKQLGPQGRRKGLAQFYELFDDFLSRSFAIDLLLPVYCPTGNASTAHPYLENKRCFVELSRKRNVNSVFALVGMCVDWYGADESGCFFEQERTLESAGLHRLGLSTVVFDDMPFFSWFSQCIPHWWNLICIPPDSREIACFAFDYQHQAVECVIMVVEGDGFEEFVIELHDHTTLLFKTRILKSAALVSTLDEYASKRLYAIDFSGTTIRPASCDFLERQMRCLESVPDLTRLRCDGDVELSFRIRLFGENSGKAVVKEAFFKAWSCLVCDDGKYGTLANQFLRPW